MPPSYDGPDRRAYDELIAKCIACEKQCSDCKSSTQKLEELRKDYYHFKDETLPMIRKDIYKLLGVLTLVGLVVGSIFTITTATEVKVEAVRDKHQGLEVVVEGMQTNQEHILKEVDKLHEGQQQILKIQQQVLQRLPKL